VEVGFGSADGFVVACWSLLCSLAWGVAALVPFVWYCCLIYLQFQLSTGLLVG